MDMSSHSAALRTFLVSHGGVLEASLETLRCAALFRSGSHVDVRAEALGAVLALLRVYRDGEGAPPALIALESARSIALLGELLTGPPGNNSRARFTVLLLIETVKAVAKLQLLKQKRGHTLRNGDLRLAETAACACGVAALPEAAHVRAVRGARSGRCILALKNEDATGADSAALFTVAYERRKAEAYAPLVTPPNACARCRARRTPSSAADSDASTSITPAPAAVQVAVGEMLHILRPVVHLVLLRTLGAGSWGAWAMALACDVGAYGCAMSKAQVEQVELNRRRMLLLLYLVRGPAFEVVLRSMLRRLAKSLGRVPFVGAPTVASVDMALLVQKLWFYTCGS